MRTKKYGIYDPDGKSKNPLTNSEYSPKYSVLSQKWRNFPMYSELDNVITAINESQILMVIAGTGSGKTVIMPKALLHYFDYKDKIGIILPRQIITESAARYAADTLDVTLGIEVGYKHKDAPDGTYCDSTKLLYMTDGTMVAKLIEDSLIRDFRGIIIDEAHERRIQTDLLLFMLKEVAANRKDFKLIIMSATIDSTQFEKYYKDYNPIVFNIGTTPNFPVKSNYLNQPIKKNDYVQVGLDFIKKILDDDDPKTNGAHDIIFFVASIPETYKICEEVRKAYEKYCIELHAGIDDVKEQILKDRTIVLDLGFNRIVYITTNVAESSLTINGIKFVIDSGFEYSSVFDPDKNLTELEKRRISKAQINQRLGRVGRTEPGTCYHLYTKQQYDEFLPYPCPPILTSDITEEIFKLLTMKEYEEVPKLKNLLKNLIDPPEDRNTSRAIETLTKISIIKDNNMTFLGKVAAELHTNPFVGIAYIAGYKLGCIKDLVAIFSVIEHDPIKKLFLPTEDVSYLQKFKEDFVQVESEHLTLLKLFIFFRQKYYSKNNREIANTGLLNPDTQQAVKTENFVSSYPSLDDWASNYNINLKILIKANKYYKKTVKRTIKVLRNYFSTEPNIVPPKDDNKTFENNILASIYKGYSLNTAYLSANKSSYETESIKKIVYSRGCFITDFYDNVMFNNIIKMNGKIFISVVSKITQQIRDIANNIEMI